MAIDLQTVLQDPDFHGLPAEERKKVLLAIDPDFKKLPAPEQDKAIIGIEQRFAKPPEIPARTLSTHIPQMPEMQLQAAHTKMQATAGDEGDRYVPSAFARPTLEGLGATIGTIAGTPAGPIGMATGGGIGFSAGKTLTDYLEELSGKGRERSKPFAQIPAMPGEKRTTPISVDSILDPAGEFIEQGSTTDRLTRPIRDAAGMTAMAGPAEGLAQLVGKTVQAGKTVVSRLRSPSFSREAAEKEAAKYIERMTSEGDVFVNNAEEAKQIEDLINAGKAQGEPQFKFSLGERTFGPSEIKAQQVIDLPAGKGATLKALRRQENEKALASFFQRNFEGEEGVAEFMGALQKRKAGLEQAQAGAEAGAQREISRVESVQPQQVGAETLESIEAAKDPVRRKMGLLEKEIPNYPMKMDNLKTEIELIKNDPKLSLDQRKAIEAFEANDLPRLLSEGENTFAAMGISRTLGDRAADLKASGQKNIAHIFDRLKNEGIKADIDAVSDLARTGKLVEYQGKAIDADKLAGQIEDNLLRLAEMKSATKIDVNAIKKGIKEGGGFVRMQVVKEGDQQYLDDLIKTYKNVTGKEPPTIGAESPDAIKRLEDRIAQDRQILSEVSPGQDVGAALKAYNQYASKEWFGRFDKGAVRRVTAKGAEEAGTKMRIESIPAQFKTPSGADDLIRAVGPERAQEAMRGSLGYDLLQKVKDGKINGKELETFLFRNKTVLEKYGLTDEFSDLKKAQALVDDVAKVSDQFEKSIAGRLLGGKTGRPVDSDKVISSILASNRTAADMRQALALVKSDPSAVKGLKKSFSQWVSDNAETTWKQLESNKATISQAKFTQDMKKAREAANVLYADDPEKINALQTMQRAYEIASRSSRAPAGVNSASAEKFVNIVAQNGRRLAVGSSKIAQAADHFWQFIKARSQGKIDEVIAQAIYDPDYAEMLVKGSRGRINPDDLEAVVGGKLIRLDDYRKPRLSQAMVGTAAQNQQGD